MFGFSVENTCAYRAAAGNPASGITGAISCDRRTVCLPKEGRSPDGTEHRTQWPGGIFALPGKKGNVAMACLQSSFARSVCRYVTTFLIPQLLFLFLFFPNAAASDSVMVARHEVLVLSEPELPITGVDLANVLKRHIPDFSQFERDVLGPADFGIGFDYRIPPPRSLTHANTAEGAMAAMAWPRDPRGISLEIGVFRSHRDALLAANLFLNSIQMTYDPPVLSTDDPGYVTWINPNSKLPDVFVRDNVFVNIEATGVLDPATVIRAIDNDLKNTAEGITRGEKVEPPLIHDVDFPSEMSISRARFGNALLSASDPNGHRVWHSVWIAGNDLPNLGPNTQPSELTEPQITWKNTGMVEFVPRGAPGTITVTLKAVAVNDLCVVSDVWTKTVRITTQEEIQPQE